MTEAERAAKAQLGKMAEYFGQQMAAVLADEQMTEAERAAKIAELKKVMTARAREVLSSNKRLEISQDARERNLNVVARDLQNTVMRLASVDRAGSLSPPNR